MKEMPEDEKLLTFKETLAYLRVSKSTLYRLMDNNEIEAHKVGGTWRFYLQDLRRFVKNDQSGKHVREKPYLSGKS